VVPDRGGPTTKMGEFPDCGPTCDLPFPEILKPRRRGAGSGRAVPGQAALRSCSGSTNAKDKPIKLSLPKLEKVEDLLAAQAAIVAAMANGYLTPEEAQIVANVVELKRRTVETVDLSRRIEELEATREGANGQP